VTRLQTLQGRFQDYLLRGDDAIRKHIAGGPQVDADRRLAVYAEAYRLRLLECLADNFPVLLLAEGDEDFDTLGRAYIETHPSNHASIRWYGDRLAEFLAQTAPWAQSPWLAELAAFEWALRNAFDAGDGPPLEEAAIAALPPTAWAGLRFDFQPSVQRLDLHWNTAAAWKALDAGDTPPGPDRSPYPVPWLVWRRDLQQYFRSLDVDEAWALDAMLDGAPFADVCEGVCEWVDAAHAPMRVAGLLKAWIAEGLLRGLRT